MMQEGLLELQEARYRDLLMCVVTLGLGERSRKLEIPACLNKDEVRGRQEDDLNTSRAAGCTC